MSDNESVQKIFNEIIWYYKYHFEDWLPLVCNAESERFTFLGREGGKHITGKRVIIKLFVLNDQSLLDILREEYLLACGKPSDYFVEIIDTIISKNKYIYLVLREEGVNLRDFINCQQYNHSESDPDYARFIIFRIACGLKVLHEKHLSHNDIKPGNIVIQGQGKVKICDLGSTAKVSQKRCGTNGYFSPQVLLKEYNTEKDDMWSLGIVFLELIKKQTEIFALKVDQEVEDIRRVCLEYILTTFYDISAHGGVWNEDINYNEIINCIKDKEYEKFNYRLKDSLLTGINEEDKEIITKLLEINPAKRLTANGLINSNLFKRKEYKFFKSNFEYEEKDFKKYLVHKKITLEQFKEFHKEIEQKIHGTPIFENKN